MAVLYFVPRRPIATSLVAQRDQPATAAPSSAFGRTDEYPLTDIRQFVTLL
jgi:hypothetical protein